MNDLLWIFQLTRFGRRPDFAAKLRPHVLASAAFDLSRRAVALALVWLIVPLGVGNLAWGQEAPPPPPPDQTDQGQAPQPQNPGYDQGQPPQQWNALSPEQLDQLVAPIALYPDSLVAQVLAAATYPTQVVEADRFVQSRAGTPPDAMAQMVNGMNWDPSVKSLAAFPSVLSNMDRNLDWTTQLGNAYYNQPQDVMSAVQSDRQQAYDAGKLRPTPQLAVTYEPGDIVIAPANPAVVYVPYYNPWAVWGWRPYYAWYAPPPPPGVYIGAGIALAFGVGIAVGAFAHWGWGWGHWGMGWGPHPFVAYNHVTYVSRSVTVVNHGYYGHFDRGPGARAFNARVAMNSRAAGYHQGFNAGAHAGYNAGAHAGYNQGFNHGAAQGYNHGAAQGYNRGYNQGAAQGYNRGAEVNRGSTNYNRGGQFNRPAQNYSHPQEHAAPQNHTYAQHGGGHPESHGGGGHAESHGGDHHH